MQILWWEVKIMILYSNSTWFLLIGESSLYMFITVKIISHQFVQHNQSQSLIVTVPLKTPPPPSFQPLSQIQRILCEAQEIPFLSKATATRKILISCRSCKTQPLWNIHPNRTFLIP